MLSNLTMIVLAAASALALLSIVNFLVAMRNDRAASAAGPIEELAVYDARLADARARLKDIEADLEERRKALADIAGVQAEVDQLQRQRESLLAEWSSLEERRAEVLAVRHDMEAAMTERQSLEAELVEKREEYLAVKDHLEKAERLVHQIDALNSEKVSIEAQVETMRDELRRLQQAEKRVADLGQRSNELEAENARLDGRLSSKESDLAEVSERLAAKRNRVAETGSEIAGIQASRAAEEQALGRVKAEMLELSDHNDLLRSKVAGQESTLGQLQQREEALWARIKLKDEEMVQRQSLKAALEEELSELRVELGTAEQAVAERTNELDILGNRRGQMEARLAHLEAEITRKEGHASGSGDPTVDPLKELKQRPPVIVQLEQLADPVQISEADAIRNVESRLRAFGLDYHTRVLCAFHTAMKVNESSQMAVLAGISGTGKSQLPRQYAAAMGIGFLQVPVQPRWDSPQDLMGFYNYIEGKFRPTDMARALWALDQHHNDEAVPDRMMMILLDEMNLARVEYYFSDFLSRLESRPARGKTGDPALRKDAEIELEIPKLANPPRIFPGYNLLFAGTMNEDESTQSLSDKVVDRANILRFAAPKRINAGNEQGQPPEVHALSQANWNSWVKPVSSVENDQALQSNLDKMVDLMRDFKRPFGHRLGRAIMDYAANYPALDGADRSRKPIADQVEMRLLPKLRGVEIDEAEQTFKELRCFVESDLGDDDLAAAITESLEAADTSGQFVWNGVTRRCRS